MILYSGVYNIIYDKVYKIPQLQTYAIISVYYHMVELCHHTYFQAYDITFQRSYLISCAYDIICLKCDIICLKCDISSGSMISYIYFHMNHN